MSKVARHLWIERKLYLVPRSTKDILSAINQVFLGHEDNNGSVTFDGKKFNIKNIDIFERFLTGWLMAQFSEECDPVLNDGSGISVELQIDTKTSGKKAREYNHDKPQC